MNAPTRPEPPTPQYDIAKLREADRQIIGEWMEWLHYEKKLSLAMWVEYPNRIWDKWSLEPVNGMTGSAFEALLAEFIGVDYEAYRQEKEEVYKWVSEQANAR